MLFRSPELVDRAPFLTNEYHGYGRATLSNSCHHQDFWLVGGGSEIASVGSSSAISISAATEGIGIAGSGLAISFDALRNMFDVRIQKSESNKGKGDGESGNSSNELKDVYNSIKDSPDYPKEFEAVKNGITKNTIKNKELLDK